MTDDVEAYSRLAGVYDEIVVDPCYDRWASFLHALWGTDGDGVRSVLDVCCGTGLLTAEMVGLGYQLVGVDSSAEMLARARALLGPGTPLLEQTLPHLHVDGVFDAAISSFDGLNYLAPDDFATTLVRLSSVLRAGAWLVFDLHTDAMMTYTAANPVVTGEAHGWTFTITSDVDTARRTCRTRIHAEHDGDDPFAETHEQFFHSDSQVRAALSHAGFDRVSVVDEYTSRPADATTLRATWIARRWGAGIPAGPFLTGTLSAVSSAPVRSRTLALSLGATGVVFGDIGTSPLYAFKESFASSGSNVNDVFGIVSLIFWALMIVVSIKYLLFVMRADNHGEGGILSLLALLPRRVRESTSGRDRALFLLVLVGTALLFGDGVLTPAISVLSATEGLELVNPALGDYAVEIAVVILIILFSVQSRGTHKIGLLFGPVMVVWFVTIAALGVFRLIDRPDALQALSPTYAVGYITSHGLASLAIASSVILAVTGAEALYADMGHFGRHPIRLSWAFLVGPSLVLCYLGQAALVMEDPAAGTNPFFALAPEGATFALVLLATAATVVASQALITGVFSLARQGIQLGLLPRLNIKHTHDEQEGQIYVPSVNAAVGVLCIAVVLLFRSSSALAHAYVLAIAGTMFITTIAFHAVASRMWHWPAYRLWPATIVFLVVDLSFLLGTMTNILRGGWVPILFGAVVMLVMLGWNNGYRALNAYMARHLTHWSAIREELAHGSAVRVPGVGIYLASAAEDVPSALSSQLKVLHAMPADVVVATVVTDSVPYAQREPVVEVVMPRVTRVTIPVGYMQTADIPAAIRASLLGEVEGVATYYLSERKFVGTDAGQVPEYRERFFGFLHKNSQTPAAYFGLPAERVIAIGTRIDL